MMSFHLVVAAVVALLIWAISTGYSAWCGRRLGLLSEEDQIEIRARRLFYGGLRHRVNCGMALLALLQLFLMRLAFHPESVLSLLLGAAGLLALFFALSGAVYQAPVWSYASLIALSLECQTWSVLLVFPGRADLQMESVWLRWASFWLCWRVVCGDKSRRLPMRRARGSFLRSGPTRRFFIVE